MDRKQLSIQHCNADAFGDAAWETITIDGDGELQKYITSLLIQDGWKWDAMCEFPTLIKKKI